MQSLDSGIPILTLDDDKMFIKSLFVPQQNINLTRCARIADKACIVFNCYVSGFMKRGYQLLETAPVLH